MSNILLVEKIKSDDELSYQQSSQTINQTNVVHGNVGLNYQPQTLQTIALTNFNAGIDQNPYKRGNFCHLSEVNETNKNFSEDVMGAINFILDNEDLLDTNEINLLHTALSTPNGNGIVSVADSIFVIKELLSFLEVNETNKNFSDYGRNVINFIINNGSLLDTESIRYLLKGLQAPTNIEYAVVSVADLIWVRKNFNKNQNRKDIVLRYLGDRKDAAFYSQNIKNNITIILENADLLTEKSINYLLQALLTQIIRTAKGDAISKVAEQILRDKVLQFLKANETNKKLPMDTVNTIGFVLQNTALLNTDAQYYLYEASRLPAEDIKTKYDIIERVADFVFARRLIGRKDKKYAVLHYLKYHRVTYVESYKYGKLYSPEVRVKIDYILDNKNLLNERLINCLIQVLSTEISKTTKSRAIANVANAMAKTKKDSVKLSLEKYEDDESYSPEVKGNISFILKNINLLDEELIDDLFHQGTNEKIQSDVIVEVAKRATAKVNAQLNAQENKDSREWWRKNGGENV